MSFHPATPPMIPQTSFVHGQQQPLLEKAGHTSVTHTVSWSLCELQRLQKLRDPCHLLPNTSVTTITFKVLKMHGPYRVYPFGFWGKLDVRQEPGDIRQLHPHIALLLSN